MARRAYWTGQIRLSLVTLPVELYTAVKSSASQVDLDQIDRNTGERVHHMNVLEDGTEVHREDIIKGYEVSKGNYVLLEPEEIQQVKLPSSDVFELTHFIDTEKIPMTHLEKPYYAVPKGKGAQEIYGVIRDALKSSGKAGVGQITLRGKEELCALFPYQNGMLVETLRYHMELRDPGEYFAGLGKTKTRSDYLTLAKQLIEQNTTDAETLEEFTDKYHEALMELIEAKQEDRAPEFKVAEKAPDKVIDLMEALRNSLKGGKGSKPKAAKSPARKAPAKRKAAPKQKTKQSPKKTASHKRKKAS